MSSFARLSVLLLFALGTPACLELGLGSNGASSGSGGSTNPDEEDDFDAEAGSCNAWKVSYCRAVDECGSVEEKSECQDEAGYVVCLEDAPYAACAKKLDGIDAPSKCGKWPDACEPEDIAERTQPYLACVQLYRSICEWRQYCNPLTTVEDCEMALEAGAPCSGFFAVIPDWAQACIDGYSRMGCGESVPPECVTDEFLKR